MSGKKISYEEIMNAANILPIAEMKDMILKSKLNINFYQELQMRSQLVDVHKDITYKSENIQLHSHRFFEIIYCKNGRVQQLVGANRYIFSKGDILVIAPGISHRPLFSEEIEEPYERIVIWIHPDVLGHVTKLWPESQKPDCMRLIRTAGTKWEYLRDYFERSVSESEHKKSNWELVVYGYVLTLIGLLSRCLEGEQQEPARAEKDELLDAVTFYIEANLEKKLTISEVAKHFFVSESTIKKKFKKYFNESIYNYVLQQRLIVAKNLIEEQETLEYVSMKVGFNDYSSFYRAFKKEYGVSPAKYRELLKKNEFY